jgi:PAS domain S-box-containing protein
MSNEKILIVEDESIVAMELADRLRALGYIVVGSAATGKQAVEKAIDKEPNLILMDIMLKGKMTGIDAAEEILSKRNIPIVFLTAYADESTLERAKITGPYGYLLKPFEERELHTTIEIALFKHHSEKKIIESEKRLSTTLKCLGEAVISTNENGIIDFLNPIAETYTGWSLSEAKGKEIEKIFTMVDEGTFELKNNPVRRVLNEGSTIGISNHSYLLSKNDIRIPINYNASPIKDADGIIKGVVLVFRDVSERKKTEKLLRESEERFRTLYENASVGIYRTTPNGEVLLANPSLIKMLGYDSFHELKSYGVKAGYISDEDRTKFKNILSEKEQVVGYEQIWKKKNGDVIVVRESARAIKDELGNVLYYDGTIEDFTIRKQMEEQLIEAKNHAESSDKIKTEFLATMSHEIRTPINTILNFISLIKEKIHENACADIKESFKIIENGSRRLIRTIDSVLNMSHLQAGNYDLRLEELNIVTEVIENIIQEFKQSAELKGLQLVLNKCDIPEVKIDRYSMTQLFANLIDNAIKYTKEGQILIYAEDTNNGSVNIIVEDSGIGMSSEFLNKIFEPFTQEDTGYTRKFEGSGLGLALVQNYARLNNAKIDVISEKNKGSKFILSIPKY